MKQRRIQTRPRRYIYRQTTIDRTAAPQKSSFERKASLLASLSQTGLLVLAIIGYFYTVRPIYTKALLDEEMAKTKIELRATEQKINANNQQLLSLKEEAARLRTQATQLQSGLESQRAQTRAAAHQANVLKIDLAEQYNQLLPRLLNEFESIAFSLCHEKHESNIAFSNCIEKEVLPSGNLYALQAADRKLLISNSRKESSRLPATWAAVTAPLDEKDRDIKQRLSAAEMKCKKLESEDNKDRNLIDEQYKCRIAFSEINREQFTARFDRIKAEQKITSSALQRITSVFYGQ